MEIFHLKASGMHPQARQGHGANWATRYIEVQYPRWGFEHFRSITDGSHFEHEETFALDGRDERIGF